MGLSVLSIASSHAQYSPLKPFEGKIGKTLEETVQSWPERVKAPAGAPNVVWILLDDVGFGASSAFGGLIQTPALDSLANNGLRYTNFHTTGICSPTRAALLTGRNAHSVAMGHHAELGIGTPGYNGDIPFEAGTMAEIFRENGYNTFALGKWHGNAPKDLTVAGPYNRWPTGRGFEHFYGFLGGSTDQWHPQLIEENNPIDIEPNTKHLNQLLADKAISYIANQKSADAEKPFFLYLAPGATHAPHHVAKEWSDKYKGKFDGGWEKYREDVFKRQQAMGLLPKGTKLPPLQNGLKPWNSLSADEKKVFARFMEVYAGFLTYTDHEIGRVFQYLRQIGQFDNTLVFVIIGDNGGSKEGSYTGNTGTGERVQGEEITRMLKEYDKIGTEYTAPNYPLGWSQAMNTPFRYWKSDVNSEGATHNPLIVHYSKGIKEKGAVRNQYGHVNDIAPTTVEWTNAAVPAAIKGFPQKPFEGTSLLYSVDDGKAPSRHTVQYYEIRGKRAIYRDGWKASVYHRPGTDFSKDVWELYHLDEDFNERFDLAAQYPGKLKELQELFDAEAKKYNVYPLNDGATSGGRLRSAFGNADSIVLYPGVDQLLNYSGPQFSRQSFSITADVDITGKDQGVLFATGGAFDGLSLFIKDGRFQVAHNTGSKVKHLTSQLALPKGPVQLKFELNYKEPQTKGSNENAGTEAIFINNVKAGERTITAAEARYIAAYKDGVDVGKDLNSPVSDRYKVPFAFTGKLNKIIIEYK